MLKHCFHYGELFNIGWPCLRWNGSRARQHAEDLADVLRAPHTETTWGLRWACAEALGELGPAGAVHAPLLAPWLGHADAQVRRAGAEALGRMGKPVAKASALRGCYLR